MLELKEFCSTLTNNRNINGKLLTEFEWENVKQIVDILSSFEKYTLKLQLVQCTLSDFYGFWISIDVKLRQKNHSLALSLLDQMNNRKEMLLNNPVLIASVYLDPRYQRALDNGQKSTAITFLKTLYQRIKSVETPDQQNNENDDPQQSTNDSSDDDFLNDVMEYLNSMQPNTTENTIQSDNINIEQVIRDFDGQRQQPLKLNILEFWENNKSIHPILYKLSSAVYSIPPTQTSVERAFSAFALVLTPHRTRLADTILQYILFVKSNKELFDAIDIKINN